MTAGTATTWFALTAALLGGCSLLFDPGNSAKLDASPNADTATGGDAAQLSLQLVPRWVRTFSGEQDHIARGCAFDSAGNVYVVGTSRGSVLLEGGTELVIGGGDDAFVASYTNDGGFRWRYREVGLDDDRLDAIAVRGNSVYVAGYFNESTAGIDFGGGPRLSQGNDAVVIKLDAISGAYQWDQVHGGPSGSFLTGVAAADDTVYISGHYDELAESSADCPALPAGAARNEFIASLDDSLDQQGACLWRKSSSLSGNGTDQPRAVAVGLEANPRVYAAASIGGQPTTGPPVTTNVGIYSYLSTGDESWVFDTKEPTSFAVAIDVEPTAQGACAAGFFRGAPISFKRDGTDPVDPGSENNAFITCRDSVGDNRWTRTIGGTGPVTARGAALFSNSILAAGSFAGDVDFGDGVVEADSEDIFIVATDVGDNSHVASFVASALGEERVFGLAVQGNSACIVGDFTGEIELGELRTADDLSRDGYVAVFDITAR